jgi:hypothetical protein
LGQDNLDRTFSTGRSDRSAWIGEPGKDRDHGTARKCQWCQESSGLGGLGAGTAGTGGQLGQDNWDRTGHPGLDSWDRTIETGRTGQVDLIGNLDRTVKT